MGRVGIRRHLRANVVAYAALFVALGGVSWAATSLPKNSVGTTQLKPNAVTGAKVKNRSLSASDLAAGVLKQGPPGQNGQQGATGATGPTGPSTGNAGGVLSGAYPNPGFANGAVTPAAIGAIPSVRVERTGTQSVTSAVSTALQFTTVEHETGGNLWDIGVPTDLVAPIAGKYLLSGGVRWNGATGGLRTITIVSTLGGVDNLAQANQIVTTADSIRQSASTVAHLVQGEVIQIAVVQDTGSALNVAPNSQTTYGSMTWLGP